MKLNKRLAPYPILTQNDDDYIDSYFDAQIEQEVGFEKIRIDISFFLKNEGLKELIEEGKAKYVAHFECPLLSYREMVVSDLTSIIKEVDLNEIANSMEVSTYIVAMKDIPRYYNKQFNWEYGADGIEIGKGDILAIGPTYTLEIDRNRDGLKKLSDIISIKQYDRGGKQEMSVALEGDVILIYVSKQIKNLYFLHGKQYLYNIISMIMVPAMMYVLSRMKADEEGLSGCRWYGVVEKLLRQNNVEVSQLRDDESEGKYSIYGVAQKIFKTPLEKGLVELNSHSERG